MNQDNSQQENQLIGQAVRAARGGRTQVEVATRIAALPGRASWRQDTLAKVEDGRRALKLAEARDLAAVLDVPIEELYGATPETSELLGTLAIAMTEYTKAEENTRKSAYSMLFQGEVLATLLARATAHKGADAELARVITVVRSLLERSTPERAVERARSEHQRGDDF